MLGLAYSSIQANSAEVFEDGFESGPLGTAWSLSYLNQGRVEVSLENGPATVLAHLILDDSVSDAFYSAAEATLTLNLANKKNVQLQFKVKSLGNEPHAPPPGNFTGVRTYDGVAISSDGGTTWRSVQSLATVGTAWEAFSVNLDASVV